MTVLFRFISTFLVSALLLTLISCGSTPSKPDNESEPQLTLGNIQRYLEQRKGLSAAEINARKVHGADFLLTKKSLDRAHKVIDTIDMAELPESAYLHLQLVKANLALAEGEPYIAKRFLFTEQTEPFIPAAKPSVAIDFFDLRAQLLFDQADFFGSINERLKISAYLTDDDPELQLNHDLIWEALAEIPTNTLYQYSKTERDAIKQGWYSLAALSKSNGANFRQQIIDIEKWQVIWPDHPASSVLPADLQLILQLADQQALNIAVFLPLSGRVSGVGNAIREGIMAAYYDDVSQNNVIPSIQFYDTEGQDINALYDQALLRGYELIIGPLSKENVAKISAREARPIPVLALNSLEHASENLLLSESLSEPKPSLETEDEYLEEPTDQPDQGSSPIVESDLESDLENSPETPQNNVFYFSLAVESEAKQVALRAWRDGHRRALVIAPTSRFGDRGFTAFEQTWLDLGGDIVDDKRYKDQRSFSSLIESSVAVSDSKARKSALQRLIGSNLEFEPRRRKDVDFIFLLAYPREAKQFLPLLAFHYAGDIPVYSTSQVFSEDKSKLSDLNGLRFSAMPWLFDTELNERRAIQAYGDNLAPYQSLYAMGVDAYHIYPRLEQLQLIRQAQFYGATGKLRLSEDNNIERTQNWAEIKNGEAIELKNETERQGDI